MVALQKLLYSSAGAAFSSGNLVAAVQGRPRIVYSTTVCVPLNFLLPRYGSSDRKQFLQPELTLPVEASDMALLRSVSPAAVSAYGGEFVSGVVYLFSQLSTSKDWLCSFFHMAK